MHKNLFVLLMAVALMLVSCDDNTDTLGVGMMPGYDFITPTYKTYTVPTESYSVGDSVLARSSTSYLGRFTDPETGTIIKSDFLAQFRCPNDFEFPDSVCGDSIQSVDLRLFVSKFVGDSLATFKLSIYPLNKVIDADQDLYTNIDPSRYCDIKQKPLITKWYTLSDRTIENEDRWTTSGSKKYYNNIRIPLPREIGQNIYDGYKEHPEYFESTETWLNSGLPCSKGFYFCLESGDGAMAYIDVAQMNLHCRYYDEGYKKDTTTIVQFAATEEVVQATSFDNSNLESLLADTEATYLKSPAGIFTLATLPTEDISENDTINSAKLTFTRYNDKVDTSFKLEIPKTVLLVRLDDYLNGYFENYKIADNETSYITSFNSSSNTYEFRNIARLIATMMQEKKNGTAKPNWNKVLLIPVEATYDQETNEGTKTLVKLCHDFSMGSTKLVGGKNGVTLNVIYSQFNK